MKRLRRGEHSSRSGSTLVLSLMAVVIVMILSVSFSQFAATVTRSSVEANDRKRAFYMAEAGLSEAYSALLLGKSGNVGSIQEPAVFGDGLFWVEANEVGALVELESHGMVGAGAADLSLVVERGEESIARLGVYSDALLEIRPGTTIDSYDSSEGPYDSRQQVHTEGEVGSNAGIWMNGTEARPTEVYGDLTPGPQSAVEIASETGEGNPFVTITGSTAPALASAELPAVKTPDVTLSEGIVHDSPVPLIIPPGTVGIEYLTARGGSDILLQGPATLVVGNMTLEETAELVFDTSGGPIELYVLDGLDFQVGSSVVTTDTEPNLVTIQAPNETLDPLRFWASSSFHGVIYAPLTTVGVSPAFEIFGSLIGSRLLLERGVRLHFDKHLATLAEESALPSQVSWRIVDLETQSGGTLLADPFDILGVDRSAMPSPFDAHKDQWLEIDYIDSGGVQRSYSGWESGFDWNDCRDLVSGTRDGEAVVIPGDLVAGNRKDPTAPAENPDPLLALLADDASASSQIRDTLVAAAPLSETTLQAAIHRDPALSGSDIRDVLEAQPLSDKILIQSIHFAKQIGDSALRDLLVAHSPLSPLVLTELTARSPALSAGDLTSVLDAQ